MMSTIKEVIFTTLHVVLISTGVLVGIQTLDYLEVAMVSEDARTRYYNDLKLVCSQYKASEVNR
jgi:uncharacterized protein YwlG (UPF0340 family)